MSHLTFLFAVNKFFEAVFVSVIYWDFILYILPFGLVRLRTFHLAHGLVRCNMSAGVHAHAERTCHSEMSQ